jgi:hypothetical protein
LTLKFNLGMCIPVVYGYIISVKFHFYFLFQILLRVSVGHSNAGKLGDIEFDCPNGMFDIGGHLFTFD